MLGDARVFYLEETEEYRQQFHVLVFPVDVVAGLPEIEAAYVAFVKEEPRKDWDCFFRHFTFIYDKVIYMRGVGATYVEFEGLSSSPIELNPDRFQRLALEVQLAEAQKVVDELKEKLK